MASPLPEIVHSLLKEHGPAAILKVLAEECRQNAEFERDNNESVAAQGWDMAASRIENIAIYVGDVVY